MVYKFHSFTLAFLITTMPSIIGRNVIGESKTFWLGPNVYSEFISIKHGVNAKLYAPSHIEPSKKLPLVVYYHGGGFLLGSTFWAPYDNFLKTLVANTNVIVLSVEYRLSELYPLPIGYDDSWSALQWIASHNTNGSNTESRLSEKVDLARIFLAGDSAGGNIAHNMAMRIASDKIEGLKIKGIALLCPFFWGSLPIGIEPWGLGRLPFAVDWLLSSRGLLKIDDVRINPLLDPKLSTLACDEVLVIVGLFDILRFRGIRYTEMLRENGYKGNVDLMKILGIHDSFLLPYFGHRYKVINQLSSFFNK